MAIKRMSTVPEPLVSKAPQQPGQRQALLTAFPSPYPDRVLGPVVSKAPQQPGQRQALLTAFPSPYPDRVLGPEGLLFSPGQNSVSPAMAEQIMQRTRDWEAANPGKGRSAPPPGMVWQNSPMGADGSMLQSGSYVPGQMPPNGGFRYDPRNDPQIALQAATAQKTAQLAAGTFPGQPPGQMMPRPFEGGMVGIDAANLRGSPQPKVTPWGGQQPVIGGPSIPQKPIAPKARTRSGFGKAGAGDISGMMHPLVSERYSNRPSLSPRIGMPPKKW